MKLLKYLQDIATLKNIISKIDYSNALVPNCTKELLEKTCDEALQYSFAAVAVFPICSEYVANRLKGSSVNSQIAVGFPCGNHFIKTCTGFGPGRATLHDLTLLKDASGDKIKLKASGGVASLEDALGFIEIGASRSAGRYNMIEQLDAIGYQP
jgi:deoxyribose-phosphate aldolase